MSAIEHATDDLETTLREQGFAFVEGARMRAALAECGSLDDWNAFTDSWNDLYVDAYMADRGRYRRRRHAVFSVDNDSGTVEQPRQPHYQSLDYNRLNGGIERWYEPIEPALRSGQSLATILRYAHGLFGALAPEVPRWHVEVHQFRIEARPGEPGQPTPEGMHRDGVDYVLVLLIDRHNIDSGTTTIHRDADTPLGSFTLTHPFDAALVDDHRVYHGVTAVEPHDATQPAWRDVLVVTFRRADAA
ncbi:2OG-Fe dioxygenase family protein [Oleiagrimonas sp. C23AA]|uniref:2OG-Fe dioxygenase family protein n=1 Tax=Oleiagrimonas sp. C23AA TaxID=2719047 RepID=UPI0014241CD6|nr:2OG-Fe dioxygenase family protein [Oleiagrimonas sp. C23AA]NII11282.1 2OG-Fe dioxygenase family protein [Oleiagrimonas sp. C23AA]